MRTAIAALFEEMADLMEILGEDPFRVSSYRRCARSLDDVTLDLAALRRDGHLQDLPGVGKSMAAKIDEYVGTGKVARHEELLAKVPPGLLELRSVPGVGPKTIARLWQEAAVDSMASLKEALQTRPEALESVHGLGPRKVQQIRDSLDFAATSAGRALLGEAWQRARALRDLVAACPGAQAVEVAGSLRRWRETIGDIDLLCSAPARQAAKIMKAFVEAPSVTRVLARGKTKSSVLLDGVIQADLRIVPAESFGAALQYFTGSKAHNVALRSRALKYKLKLNEYGLFTGGDPPRQVAGADEEGLYKALDLAWIAPELREDAGEIDAAARAALPRLLEESDIRGDLHMHTTASDGRAGIDEMIDACRQRGYAYMAITDHSVSQRQARGLDRRRMAAHARAIRAAAEKCRDIDVLAGVEIDILKDGSLDYPDEFLAKMDLDFVVASPHAALSQKGPEATRRLLRAIANPHVHCIGHPTGRLVKGRAGMEIDIAAVAKAAARHGVALEVNASPERLDLRDVHIRAALDAGAVLVICTDAHTPSPEGDLSLMPYGVHTARRGWARPEQVINTWPAEKLRAWLRGRRDRR